MRQLPEIHSWRKEVDTEHAEQQVRWLREKIFAADQAIEAQQRIIASDGPLNAYLLSIDNLRNSQAKNESALADIMRARELEVIDFALAGKRYDEHRASAKSLAIFFDAMQRLFERVGQSLNTTRITPAIPPQIRNLCQLEVAGFYPSSFGIRFTAATRSDLTGTSVSNSALEATFELVNANNPLEQAAKLGQRVMTNYRHLINTMVKVEATPKVGWRSPDGQHRSWIADENSLLVMANRLAKIHETQPRTLKVTGTLTGASLRRHKFEFTGDNGLVTGTAPTELANKVTEFFGRNCRITFVETTYIDEATDQEKRSRVLVDIEAR